MHSSVKWNLLSWHGSFVGKKWKTTLSAGVYIGLYGKKETGGHLMMTRSWIIYKKNDVQSNQKIKYDFMSVFLCWIKMYIE